MSELPSPPGPAPLQSIRVLALTLCSAPVVILLAMYLVLGGEPRAFDPPAWAIAAPVVLALGAMGLIQAVGYRTQPLEPGTPPSDAVAQGAQAFHSLMILRFALAEAPIIISLALGFVVEQGGFLVVLLGVVCGMPLLFWHVLPRDRQITLVQAGLESSGARVPLHAHLHGQPTG